MAGSPDGKRPDAPASTETPAVSAACARARCERLEGRSARPGVGGRLGMREEGEEGLQMAVGAVGGKSGHV